MKTLSYWLKDLKDRTIPIGFVGENLYRRVIINCKEIFDDDPDLVPAISITPPKGDSYPGIVTRDGDLVYWDIQDSDLANKGNGEIQLSFVEFHNGVQVDNGVVGKSYTGRFRVERSIEPAGEAPEVLDDFITEASAIVAAIPQTIDDALEEAKESGEFDGEDGYSPTVNITEITGGYRITIVDKDGTHTADVMDGEDGEPGDDGYSPTVLITSITGGHRITITDKNGDHTADIMDGQDGDPGTPGADGVSPTVAITNITGGHTVTITDKNGSHAFNVMDGVSAIDDTAGEGDTDKVWSADKSASEVSRAFGAITNNSIGRKPMILTENSYIVTSGDYAGQAIYRSGYSSTDFIAVDGSYVAIVATANSGFNCFYDANKGFIANSGFNVVTGKNKIPIPTGAKFVRLSGTTSAMNGEIVYLESTETLQLLSAKVSRSFPFYSDIINQTGFFDKTQSGYYGNDGEIVSHNSFSCSSIFITDEVPTYYSAFHSVVTWKDDVCNGQTLYENIGNVPAFDRIAFNYTTAQKAVGVDVRYGGKYADPDAIEQNTADIEEIQIVTDGLADKIGVLEEKTYSQENQLTWIAGSYTNDGSISTVLANYYHSDYIYVQPGYVISYTNLRAFGTWSLIAAFDETKQFLSAKTLFASDSNFASGTWTVPEGVEYISLSAYNPTTAVMNKWQVTIPTFVWVSELVRTAGSPWKGKSAVIIGDSITAGAYTATGGSSPDQFADPTFWEIAADLQGMSITGYGISGTSISRTSGTLPSYAMSIRYVDMVNADLVIVAGGTNDYGTNVALGTIADQTDISFYGALNVLCDGLQTKYPGKRIVFITPIHRANEEANQAGATLEQYRQAIYDVARDVYGFAVIDGRTMGISCKNATFKNVYIYDGLHPTQEGHNVYGQCFGHALNGV